MKFPNWFKISWWILLIALTGFILFKRFDAIANGQSVTADVFIFLVFVALLLVPIFSEFEFLGLKLKQQIEELETEIKVKFGDLKNELKNEIRNSQTQTLHQTFAYGPYGPPPPDNKLPELENEIDRVLKSKLKEHGITVEEQDLLNVPNNNLKLFKVRYNIENELRRIWEQRFANEDTEFNRRKQPILRNIQELVEYRIIDKEIYHILREILSICNYAIHGEKVSDKQVDFAINNGNEILSYLKNIY